MAHQQLILDRYRIVDKAGSGGYGTVYHAYDTRLKRDAAIKCIKLSEADVARARLLAMEEMIRADQEQWDEESSTSSAAASSFDEGAQWHDDGSSGVARSADDVPPWVDIDDEDDFVSDAHADAHADARGIDRRAQRASHTPLSDPSDDELEDEALFRRSDATRRIGRVATGESSFVPASAATSVIRRRHAGSGLLGASVDALGGRRAGDLGEASSPAFASPAASAVSAASAEQRPSMTITPDDIDDDDLFEHIPGLEEARTAAHLSDSNIVTVYDCEFHNDTAYVIMEYVEGKTLQEIMSEIGDDITLDMIAAVFTSIAHALEIAHDKHVLHLDIKPENVLVNSKGVVKVTDFGLATLVDSAGHATTGAGTIGYMPLEQMRQESLDVRTDEWALASLTYEMLSGSNPFFAQTMRQAEENVENAELVLPSLCWDELDAKADDVVFRALDPDPDERYESVADFADALAPYLGSTRAGKKELAALVNGEREEPEPPAPRAPLPPIIDRIGPAGASIIARVLSVASVVMVSAVALVNIRPDAAAMFGLATTCPPAFWLLLAGIAGLTAWQPRFGVAPAFAAFSAMLLFNHAYIPGVALPVIVGAWWWMVGRQSNGATLALLLQPLLGSFGMAAFAPIAAGALLSVRQAVLTACAAASSAIAFASLGSGSVLSWDIVGHAVTPASSAVGATYMGDAFVQTVVSSASWCVIAGWIAAAAVFSLFCVRGTRAFDIAGSAAALVLLVAGVVLGAGADSLISQIAANGGSLSGGADVAVSWAPDPLSVAGAIIPGAAGVVLAVMDVTDRVRLAEGEW